jgi:hypothetical protein
MYTILKTKIHEVTQKILVAKLVNTRNWGTNRPQTSRKIRRKSTANVAQTVRTQGTNGLRKQPIVQQ